jgi:Flp pilus assembly protein TadD
VRGTDDPDLQLQRAVEDFERAVALRPSHPQSRDSLATAYSLIGDFDAAQRHAEIAVKLDPADWNLHRNLAISLADARQPEAALDRFRTMAAVAPHSPEVRLVLAQALVEARRFDEALAAFDVAIEQASALAPDKPQMAAVVRRAFDLKVAAKALRRRVDGP